MSATTVRVAYNPTVLLDGCYKCNSHCTASSTIRVEWVQQLSELLTTRMLLPAQLFSLGKRYNRRSCIQPTLLLDGCNKYKSYCQHNFSGWVSDTTVGVAYNPALLLDGCHKGKSYCQLNYSCWASDTTVRVAYNPALLLDRCYKCKSYCQLNYSCWMSATTVRVAYNLPFCWMGVTSAKATASPTIHVE
jgi:hypothetical protein